MPSPSFTCQQPADLDPLGDLRRDMMVWAEPVIADRIWDSYRDLRIGAAFRSLLAIQHRRLWRALILQKVELADQIRGELALDLTQAGVSPDVVSGTDNDIMEELMDIVFTRFRGSRDTARGLSRVLLAAASDIGAARLLAA